MCFSLISCILVPNQASLIDLFKQSFFPLYILHKDFVCEFVVKKEDIINCEHGEILFVQFSPLYSNYVSLFIHGGIIIRTDTKYNISKI